MYLLLALLTAANLLAVLVADELLKELLVGKLLPIVLFGGELLGDGKIGHNRRVVNTVELHLIQHLQRIGQGFGYVGKDFIHLSLRLEPLLLGIKHSFRIVKVAGSTEADEAVVSFGIVFVNEVYVVGTHDFDIIFLCQFKDDSIGLLLKWERLAVGTLIRISHLMALDFKVIIIAEDALIPLYSFLCTFDVAFQDQAWHLSCQTSRADNETFGMTFQLVMVGTRTIVEAVYPSLRNQLDQVVVAYFVLCQYNKVISAGVFILVAVVECSFGHIHFTTEDGLERLLPSFLQLFILLVYVVKVLLHAHHVAMVGNGHAAHTVLDSLLHQLGDAGLTVKQRVLCMYVKMYEVLHVLQRIW